MKSKKKIIVCLVFTFFFGASAFSEESKFCTNPLKTICVDTKIETTKLNDSIKHLKDQIFNEAVKNAKPKIDKLEKQYTDSWYIRDKEQLRYIILNQEIIKSANSRISGLEKVVTNMNSVSMFKSYFKLAIDESNFNQSTRNAFKKTIDSVKIGSFNDYKIFSGNKYELSNLKKFPCGVDGMEVNAFSTSILNQKYVFICPGLLINYSQNSNEQERLSNILFAITHEMGHHVGNSETTKKVFAPYMSCLAKHYNHAFNSSKEDQIFCAKVAKNNQECRVKVTVSHSRELIADQWSIQVLAIYAKKNRCSVAQTDSLLTNNYVKICGRNDQGIHPSGNFRIETLLRINPAISDYLSCNNSKIKKPACTFDGEISL